MNPHILAISISVLVFGSCTHRQPIGSGATTHHEQPTQPIRQATLSTHDLKRVRHPEFIKTYHLGRTVSKNGRLMHEAHRVYQLEKSPRWNRLRHNPPWESTGPVSMLHDSAFRPLPAARQLRAEKQRQQALNEQLEGARDQTEAQLIILKERLATQTDHARQIATLKAELEKERQARHALEQQPAPNDDAPDPKQRASQLRQWGEEQPTQP